MFRFYPLDFALSSMARSNKMTASTMLHLWAHRPRCRKTLLPPDFRRTRPWKFERKEESECTTTAARQYLWCYGSRANQEGGRSQGRATGWMIGGKKWWLISTLNSFMHQRRSRVKPLNLYGTRSKSMILGNTEYHGAGQWVRIFVAISS